MAVRKDDVQELPENEKATIDFLEGAIDEHLKGSYLPGQKKTYNLTDVRRRSQSLSRLAPVNVRIMHLLADRYRAAGWTVEDNTTMMEITLQ